MYVDNLDNDLPGPYIVSRVQSPVTQSSTNVGDRLFENLDKAPHIAIRWANHEARGFREPYESATIYIHGSDGRYMRVVAPSYIK